MLVKTEGIVLNTLKHTDSGIIAHLLTKEYGHLSFIVKGTHSKRGGTRAVYFQALQILDVELYYKEGRNLNSIKEVAISYRLNSIPFNIYRGSIAMFISEIIHRTLSETEPNNSLYNYIRESIIYLDSSTDETPNFHIGFLVGLSKYLGILPDSGEYSYGTYFDIQNGNFCNNPPLHGYYLEKEHTLFLRQFMEATIEDCEKITLTGKTRGALLQSILSFFSFHLPGIRNVKSLEVLTQLFT